MTAAHQANSPFYHLSLPQWLAVAGLLVALFIGVFPPAGLSTEAARAAPIALMAITLWATGVFPEHLTSLAFFLLCMLFAVAPPAVVFSGFSSAALWLVFAGLIMGAAVRSTGLGARAAARVARVLDRSYLMLITGMVLVGVLLGFLMPSSMGRVVLLVPIALAVADHFGFAAGSKGRTALVLAAAFGSHVPTFAILPANVPNMVLVGAAESMYSVSPLYGSYLWLHFPVLGLLKAVVLIALIYKMFPDRLAAPGDGSEALPPSNADQRKLWWVLLISLALWTTDSWHHISPAWVALAAAVLIMLPRVGMVTTRQFSQDINYGSLFFVAGVIGLGALVARSGLGDALARVLLDWLPLAPGHNFQNFLSLSTAALVTGVVTTLPGVPAVLTPLAGKLAHASGLPLQTVLMTQVMGFSTTLLPYQSAPLVVAAQMAGEGLAATARLCLVLALVTLLVLWPLDYLWWQLTGWL